MHLNVEWIFNVISHILIKCKNVKAKLKKFNKYKNVINNNNKRISGGNFFSPIYYLHISFLCLSSAGSVEHIITSQTQKLLT